MKPTILVVDDDNSVRVSLKTLLEDQYQPLPVASSLEALEKIKNANALDLVLLDITMPDQDGIITLKQIKELEPSIEVIMVTGNQKTEMAVKAMKEGAYDYVTKPFDNDDLIAIIDRALEKRKLSRLNQALVYELDDLIASTLIGKSEAMKGIHTLIERVADADSTVLIHGESGTGKELAAGPNNNRGGGPLNPWGP